MQVATTLIELDNKCLQGMTTLLLTPALHTLQTNRWRRR